MKYPFVNATIADKKKGREAMAPTTHTHPARETVILSPDSHRPASHPYNFVWPKSHAKAPVAPVDDELSRIRKEVEKMMAAQASLKRSVPKSRILGMANAAPEPVRDYTDVLAMLLAKK